MFKASSFSEGFSDIDVFFSTSSGVWEFFSDVINSQPISSVLKSTLLAAMGFLSCDQSTDKSRRVRLR